jgi:hypothetical protein
VGTDEQGQAVVALQAGALPPFQLRLTDEEARHVASSLSEIHVEHGDLLVAVLIGQIDLAVVIDRGKELADGAHECAGI